MVQEQIKAFLFHVKCLQVITPLLYFIHSTSHSNISSYNDTERDDSNPSHPYDPDCGCRRLLSHPVAVNGTCSKYAASRGPGQRVVAFTMFDRFYPLVLDLKRHIK